MVLVNINIETDYFLTSTFMQFDLQTAFGSVAQKKGVCSSDPCQHPPLPVLLSSIVLPFDLPLIFL